MASPGAANLALDISIQQSLDMSLRGTRGSFDQNPKVLRFFGSVFQRLMFDIDK
jgi:hypothetical protein